MPLFFELNYMEEANELLKIAHRIEKGGKKKVVVLGKTFYIRDTKRNILNKIHDIQFKVEYFEGKEDLKTIQKRLKYINSSDARTASLLLLNEWANIPFVHSIHWRWLNRRYTTEVLSAIIETGLDDRETAFFLKNSVLKRNMVMARVMMAKS